jgi:hypothetical protein
MKLSLQECLCFLVSKDHEDVRLALLSGSSAGTRASRISDERDIAHGMRAANRFWLGEVHASEQGRCDLALSERSLFSLTLDEGQNIGIDDVRMGRHQTMREARINLERAIFEQFGLQQ